MAFGYCMTYLPRRAQAGWRNRPLTGWNNSGPTRLILRISNRVCIPGWFIKLPVYYFSCIWKPQTHWPNTRWRHPIQAINGWIQNKLPPADRAPRQGRTGMESPMGKCLKWWRSRTAAKKCSKEPEKQSWEWSLQVWALREFSYCHLSLNVFGFGPITRFYGNIHHSHIHVPGKWIFPARHSDNQMIIC